MMVNAQYIEVIICRDYIYENYVPGTILISTNKLSLTNEETRAQAVVTQRGQTY